MVSLLSLITLLPMVVSAARIPYHRLDHRPSLVSTTESKVDLELAPRSPSIPILNDILDDVPIVGDVVQVVGGLLPQIDAGLSFCITLAVDATLNIGAINPLFLAAGTCLCVDADVEVNPSAGQVKVATSIGLTLEGEVAIKLRRSIINCLHGSPNSGPDYFHLEVDAGVCLQLDLFVGYTEHDFSANDRGVDRCCARRCTAPYVPGPNNQCVCPQANMCGGQCLSGPALLCGGTCHLASNTVCSSGSPQPKVVEYQAVKRRSAIPFGRCSYGQELCPVATSSGYECVNTYNDMESCGGCVHSFRGAGKQGQDCTAIPNVDEVLCNRGSCLVQSCEQGYRIANNGTMCVEESRLDLDIKQAAVLTFERLDLVG